jgi:hypothetical protein
LMNSLDLSGKPPSWIEKAVFPREVDKT